MPSRLEHRADAAGVTGAIVAQPVEQIEARLQAVQRPVHFLAPLFGAAQLFAAGGDFGVEGGYFRLCGRYRSFGLAGGVLGSSQCGRSRLGVETRGSERRLLLCAALQSLAGC